MDNLATDDLLAFATTLERRELRTAARGARFRVRVFPDSLTITPDSTERRRIVPREVLDRVCAEYSESGSLKPSDYLSLTFDSSYLLAIIELMEETSEG